MSIKYDYSGVPHELKVLKQWVCWTNEKLPKNPYTGGNAQSNNPETWSDFDTAIKAIDKYGFSGLGFMFANGYFGVDLDKCLDEVDFVDEFVETLQSYNEISKSNNGIHVICKGILPEGARRKKNVEMYSSGRYFIMTGNMYQPKYSKIEDCTESVKVLHRKYLHTDTPTTVPVAKVQIVNLDDQKVLELARSCKTGTVFQLLYSGNWQGIYSSQSEADLALCNQLAFWTQKDEGQIDRIFRSSNLYRKKWDEKRGAMTYGQSTITKACVGTNKVYEPRMEGEIKDLAFGFFGDNGEAQVKIPKKLYDMTDTGNAQRFRDKYIGMVKYSYNRKKWYYWTGKNWALDLTGEIKKLADEIVEDIKREAIEERDDDKQAELFKWASRTASSKGKTNMITEAQHLDGIPILPEEMDSHVDLLNCQNGIVNLANGELIPHDSSFNMSLLSYTEYDPEMKPPKMWLKFLNDVTNGDKELQRYIQKSVGYSLSGSIKEQCAYFLYGLGNNGKSTFLDTISELMGTYASNTQPDTIMARKGDNGAAKGDIARLKSARFVTSEEPTEGVRLNEGLVKQLTGGGKITCRFLYGDDFEYVPEFKIWIATNHKPVIRGTDVGIWRRIRLIPFEVNIPKEKVDKNLKYKLRKELPQILAWAVQGCMLWQQEGLELPEVVKKATNDYKVEMDMLASFVEACVEIDYSVEEKIPASDLFSIYDKWATQNNEYVMSSRKFYLEIAKKLPEKTRGRNGIMYGKIKLTETGEAMKRAHKGFTFTDFT